jgi:hypothetical protein
MESHPYLDRVPDQSVIRENNNTPAERIQATRGNDYIFVYSAEGKPFTVVASKITGEQLNAYWFDPRTGKVTSVGTFANNQDNKFTPPSQGYGKDWVLVLDDASKNYKM